MGFILDSPWATCSHLESAPELLAHTHTLDKTIRPNHRIATSLHNPPSDISVRTHHSACLALTDSFVSPYSKINFCRKHFTKKSVDKHFIYATFESSPKKRPLERDTFGETEQRVNAQKAHRN